MSTEAAKLLRQIAEAPVSVQREVTAALLALQFSSARAEKGSRVSLRQIAGKFHPQPNSDAKPHDAWFAEAIQSSKGAESQG